MIKCLVIEFKEMLYESRNNWSFDNFQSTLKPGDYFAAQPAYAFLSGNKVIPSGSSGPCTCRSRLEPSFGSLCNRSRPACSSASCKPRACAASSFSRLAPLVEK